jgi:hypothetical protein
MEPEGSLPCSQEPSPLVPIQSQIDPVHMSILFSLGRLSKESIQVRGPLWHFVTS